MSAKITEEQKKQAIEAYALNGNLSTTGRLVNISRQTLWAEMNRSPQFKKAMQGSKDIFVESLEEKLHTVLDGKEPIDRTWGLLMMFTLKAHDHKYRDKVDHQVEGDIRIITGVPRPKAERKKG